MDPEVAKALKSLGDRVQGLAHGRFEDEKDIKLLEDAVKDLQQRVAKLEKGK